MFHLVHMGHVKGDRSQPESVRSLREKSWAWEKQNANFKWQSDFVGHIENLSHPSRPLSFQTKLCPYPKEENPPFLQQQGGPAPCSELSHDVSDFLSSFLQLLSFIAGAVRGETVIQGTLDLKVTCGEYSWVLCLLKAVTHNQFLYSPVNSWIGKLIRRFSWLVSMYLTNIYWVPNMCCGYGIQRCFTLASQNIVERIVFSPLVMSPPRPSWNFH